MAVAAFEVTTEEWDALAALTTEGMTLRISVWPDAITIDNGDSVIIELRESSEMVCPPLFSQGPVEDTHEHDWHLMYDDALGRLWTCSCGAEKRAGVVSQGVPEKREL